MKKEEEEIPNSLPCPTSHFTPLIVFAGGLLGHEADAVVCQLASSLPLDVMQN